MLPAPHKPSQTSHQPLHISLHPGDPGTVQGDLLWPGHGIPAVPTPPLTPARELPSPSTEFRLQEGTSHQTCSGIGDSGRSTPFPSPSES